MTHGETQKLMDYALSCCADVSHGGGHIRRVLANALKLAGYYPEADKDVLSAAAILHDCAQAEQLHDPRVHHAAEGAKKAKAFLVANGYDEAFARRVSMRSTVCARSAALSKPKRPNIFSTYFTYASRIERVCSSSSR